MCGAKCVWHGLVGPTGGGRGKAWRGHGARDKAHGNLTSAKMVILEECKRPSSLCCPWQPTRGPSGKHGCPLSRMFVAHVAAQRGSCPRACTWLPTVVPVRGSCGCPWPPIGVPSRVPLAAHLCVSVAEVALGDAQGKAHTPAPTQCLGMPRTRHSLAQTRRL